jgi:hypothetical protein
MSYDNPDNKYNYRTHSYKCPCGSMVLFREAPEVSDEYYNHWDHMSPKLDTGIPEPVDFYSTINYVFETELSTTKKVM